jgi:hypothetical protein
MWTKMEIRCLSAMVAYGREEESQSQKGHQEGEAPAHAEGEEGAEETLAKNDLTVAREEEKTEMNDQEFSELAIAASIAPQQVDWPNDLSHWQRLNECVVAARAAVSKMQAAITKVENDRELSREGKAAKRSEIAKQALASLEKSTALTKARDAVAVCQAQWSKKISEVIKQAEDLHSATVAAQIRDRVASMKPEQRMKWLSQHAIDTVICSALLTAPAYLSDLSEAEHALVKQRAEKLALTPEVIEAKALTEKALEQVERGWRVAISKIEGRAGLSKNPDGTSSVATTQGLRVA